MQKRRQEECDSQRGWRTPRKHLPECAQSPVCFLMRDGNGMDRDERGGREELGGIKGRRKTVTRIKKYENNPLSMKEKILRS